MLHRFKQFISRNGLIRKGETILLAISGGADSVVMAELFKQAGYKFAIAHCNFSLRGKESDVDESFVRDMAKKHCAKFYHKKFDTNTYAEKNHMSIQEAARELRYQWFEELRVKHSYHRIATAHHLDDSIETFFINLFRGTGITGLTGIPAKTKRIIRPMLFAKKNDIITFAKENNILWREDSSNLEADYLRNRIRQQLIPRILELQPGFAEKMESNFTHLILAEKAYSQLVQSLNKKFVRKKSPELFSIDLSKLRKEEFPEAILSALLHAFGIFGADCESMLRNESQGKVFPAGQGRILRDRDILYLETNPVRQKKIVRIPISTKHIILDDGILELDIKPAIGKFNKAAKAGVHKLDAKKVRFPLVVRAWKAGDFFFPLGMSHRKKLSDFFINKKLSLFEKENCRVVVSGKDIICILGHRIDDRYKVIPETKKILTLVFSYSTR